MGAGYDIRIVANVTGGTSWESTSWTTGGVTRCVNHSDQDGNGTQTVDLEYEYEANAAIKAAERRPGNLPDPDKVGPSEHVFPPPPGGTSHAAGRALHERQLLRERPRESERSPSRPTSPRPTSRSLAACQGMKVAVVLDESGSIGSAAPQVRNATKALARGLVDTGARMAVFKFSTTAEPELHSSVPDDHPGVRSTASSTTYLNNYDPGGYDELGGRAAHRLATDTAGRQARPRRLPHRRQPEPLGRRRHRRRGGLLLGDEPRG